MWCFVVEEEEKMRVNGWGGGDLRKGEHRYTPKQGYVSSALGKVTKEPNRDIGTSEICIYRYSDIPMSLCPDNPIHR